MKNPVGWFEIYVQDMARAKKFYAAILGVEFTELPSPRLEMWQFPADMNGPGCTGTLCKMEGVASGGGGTLVYFMTDDCGAVARRAAENGGSIHMDKMSIGEHGHIALVIDCEGNMIGLHSMA